MSKLVERLRRAAEGVSQPMGFAVLAQARVPPMVVMAQLQKTTGDLLGSAVQNGAEFLLFSNKNGQLPESLPPKGIENTPWGVRIASVSEEQHRALKEAGCDFVLLSFGETPARLLADEDLGAMVAVPVGTEDRVLRAVEQLPVEAAFIDAEASPELTVKQLMDYATVACTLGQSLVAPVSPQWSGADLEQLREIGVTGLVVDVSGPGDLEGLRSVREAVQGLPTRSRKREERMRARLPHISPGAPQQRDDEEEDDDDDE